MAGLISFKPLGQSALGAASDAIASLIKPAKAPVHGPTVSVDEAKKRLEDATAAATKYREEMARLSTARATLHFEDEAALDTHADLENRVKLRLDVTERAVAEAIEAHAQAQAAEDEARRQAKRDGAEKRRDAVKKRIEREYPDFVAKITALQADIRASDAELWAVNRDLPAMAVSLYGAEFLARGTPGREAVVSQETKTLWTRDGDRMPLERQDSVRVNGDGRTGTIVHQGRVGVGAPETATLRAFRIIKTAERRMLGAPKASILDIDLPPVRDLETTPSVTTRIEMIDDVMPAEPRFVPYDRSDFSGDAA